MPGRDFSVLFGVVLLVRVGQTLLLSGSVRSKNAAGSAVRCVLDLAVVVLAVWAIGGVFVPPLASGGAPPWLTFRHVFGNSDGLYVTLLPALLIATGASVGATAERMRLGPQLVLSAVTAGLVFPMLWRFGLEWYGRGDHADVALALGILGGGASAMVAAGVVGARKDKFNRDQSVNFVPGHSVVYQIVGLLLLAAGFCPTVLNGFHVVLGLCAAVIAGALVGRLRFGKIDAGLLVAAGVGGLCAAALASSAGTERALPGWLGNGGGAAVLGGALAGAVVPWAVVMLEIRFRVDDVAGLGVAYLTGGTIGLAVEALTRHTETVAVYFRDLGADAVFWLVTLGVCGGVAFAIATLFARRGALRVSETVEYDGADLSELDVNAYPDFQQTMIKSHHLRQL